MPRRSRSTRQPGPQPRTKPKQAVKRCIRGHRQPASWKPGGWCPECTWEDKEAADARIRARERAAEAQLREANAPAFLQIKTVDTGRVRTFAIPPGQQRRKAAGKRRRGRV